MAKRTYTKITSNGSGAAITGKKGIAALLKMLAEHPLDRTFEDERFGNFYYRAEYLDGTVTPKDQVSFFGNFFDYSHVFNIDTNDPDVIAKLTAAIDKNKLRPDYLSQETYEARRARESAEAAERFAKIDEERKAQARRTLGLEAA